MKGVLGRLRDRTGEEDGFTLIETIIAVTIIFGSLLALAYTATIGSATEISPGRSRRRRASRTRPWKASAGLAYDTMAKGLLSSDLGSDANIINCGRSPVVYRYLSCAAGSTPGSGEKIVNSASAANPTVPLVPHTGTITKNGVAYTWSVYLTNNCPAVDAASVPPCTTASPYRITVLVTWAAGKNAPNKLVGFQLDLLTERMSQHGHAPVRRSVPVLLLRDVDRAARAADRDGRERRHLGLTFTSGDLFTGSVESAVQQEQLTQAQGAYTPVGVRLVDGGGTTTSGAVQETTTAADSDPGSSSVSPIHGHADFTRICLDLDQPVGRWLDEYRVHLSRGRHGAQRQHDLGRRGERVPAAHRHRRDRLAAVLRFAPSARGNADLGPDDERVHAGARDRDARAGGRGGRQPEQDVREPRPEPDEQLVHARDQHRRMHVGDDHPSVRHDQHRRVALGDDRARELGRGRCVERVSPSRSSGTRTRPPQRVESRPRFRRRRSRRGPLLLEWRGLLEPVGDLGVDQLAEPVEHLLPGDQRAHRGRLDVDRLGNRWRPR